VGGTCGMNGRGDKVYRVLVGKTKRKRPLRRRRCKLEDEMRMDLREIGWGAGVEWFQLAQDRDCCPGRASPLGKGSPVPLDRRLGGPQSWSRDRG
jgi:hypothetical protein